MNRDVAMALVLALLIEALFSPIRDIILAFRFPKQHETDGEQ